MFISVLFFTKFSKYLHSPSSGHPQRYMQFFCPVKSINLCVSAKKKVLHKRIFVIFFCVCFHQALNLTYCKLTDSSQAVSISPHKKKINTVASVHNLVHTERTAGNTEGRAFSEFCQSVSGRKTFSTCCNINIIIFIL